jgi:hypothetical protein
MSGQAGADAGSIWRTGEVVGVAAGTAIVAAASLAKRSIPRNGNAETDRYA